MADPTWNISVPPIPNFNFTVIQLPASVEKESVALLIGFILGILWAAIFVVWTNKVSQPPKMPELSGNSNAEHTHGDSSYAHEMEGRIDDDERPADDFPPPPEQPPPNYGRPPPQPPVPPPR
jgi:hypothetical protein